jgi:hypothetical protein
MRRKVLVTIEQQGAEIDTFATFVGWSTVRILGAR